MPRGKKILFVCVGNACRSQMAEAIARFLGYGKFESAGVRAIGYIPDLVPKVLDEIGIPFPPDARSKQLDPSRVGKFDKVVVMARMNFLAPTDVEFWDVEDPFGGFEKEFRDARDKILVLVTELLAREGILKKRKLKRLLKKLPPHLAELVKSKVRL